MAITIIRKKTQPQPQLSAPVEAVPDEAELQAIGLARAKAPPADLARFPIGARVRITNTLFPWIRNYQPGDTGIVLRYMPATLVPPARRPKDDLYDLELDLIRVPGQRLALLQFWELEMVEEKPQPKITNHHKAPVKAHA